MSTQSKFFFNAQDNTSKAFQTIKKALRQVSLQTVALTTAMKALSAAVKLAANALTKILGAALNAIVSLVKFALNTIKKLITGAFNFIKTALTTLLSWIKKALGKVFDWIKSTVTGILSSISKVASDAVKLAKKAVKTIVESVQAYADKEYNEIQLKVSLGDSYDTVMKSFKELLRYTTADKNDLLSIFATYTEVGKKPEEIAKYAKATVYLANATGRSLSQITRLLLGQEAASSDLERTLKRIGINISEQEASLSNVDKIISQMDAEMTALANNSLNQIFANIKNDIIAIKENLGKLFSGPVRYVAQKIEGILSKIAGSNKLDSLAGRLDSIFDKIKPIIDKIFEFFEKFIADPTGFFKALWADVQMIFNNFISNLGTYIQIAGFVLGSLIGRLIEVVQGIKFADISGSLDSLASALSSFSIQLGLGAGWFKEEDVVEDSFRKTFINAWNRAHEGFDLSAEDPWYINLGTMIRSVLSDIGSWLTEKWNTFIKPKIVDPFVESWNTTIRPMLETTFQYLGKVLGVAINNAIASSDVIRTVLNIIPGVNFASAEEAANVRASLYGKVKDYLPAGWTADDLTKENLMNTQYSKNSNLMYYLYQFAQEEISWLRKYTVLDQQAYPSWEEYTGAINSIIHPTKDISDQMGPLTDALRDFREITDKPFFHFTGSGFTVSPVGGVGGSGGIQDFYSNEFRIKPYAKGGLVTEPTVALIGEAGPEAVVPLSDSSASSGSVLKGILIALDANTEGLDKLTGNLIPLISGETSSLVDWWNNTTIDNTDAIEDLTEEVKESIPWYKRVWNAMKAVGGGFAKYIGKSFTFLANNGAFGSHIGNITSGIKAQADNGTLTIWSALGEVIKEFLPYLQKGLEVIGNLFDQAFDILGNVVQILGERLGKVLLPILEAFIPLMKTIGDILISLAPVIEAILQPAITIIAAILRALVPILDILMPAFAGIGAVIQWVSESISWIIGSLLNWLGSINIAGWHPFGGLGGNDVKKPTSIKDNYNSIMSTYNDARAQATPSMNTSSVGVAGQTASYNGAMTVNITNDFSGSYVVGTNGFRELALIIKQTLEDAEYAGQSI